MLKNRKKPGRPVGTRNGQTRDDLLRLLAAGHGGMKLAELGTLLGVTDSSIGYHIEKLTEAGLARVLSTGFVTLTDAGADAFEAQERAA